MKMTLMNTMSMTRSLHYELGTFVTVLGHDGNWLKISVDGNVGYISGNYVDTVPPVGGGAGVSFETPTGSSPADEITDNSAASATIIIGN